MLLSDDIIKIMGEGEPLKLEDLAKKTNLNHKIGYFKEYVESLVESNLLKYNRETGEYSL